MNHPNTNNLKRYKLPVSSNILGEVVSIPVLQVGSGAPHVVMVALQHGWEIIGLDTALQLMENIDTTGTITLISAANPFAYCDGYRMSGHYMGPSSNQRTNMNRTWPGNETGNETERTAYIIDRHIQSIKPDFVIDLHSYASQSVPHIIVDNSSNTKLQQRVDNWAKQAQIAWYREYDDSTLIAQALDKALSAVWMNRGVPAITLELGPLRLFSTVQSDAAQKALQNTLIACGVIQAELMPLAPDLQDTSWRRREIVYIGSKSGYLRASTPILHPVKQGEILGYVVTPDGVIQGNITAPATGMHFIWEDEFRILPGSEVGVMLEPLNR